MTFCVPQTPLDVTSTRSACKENAGGLKIRYLVHKNSTLTSSHTQGPLPFILHRHKQFI